MQATLRHMNWWSYIRDVTADPQKQIAARCGVEQSTVSRWKQDQSNPEPAAAAAFARAYSRPVLEAFLAAGFLTPSEARQRPPSRTEAAQLSDDQILAELRERLRSRQRSSRRLQAARKGPIEPEHETEL